VGYVRRQFPPSSPRRLASWYSCSKYSSVLSPYPGLLAFNNKISTEIVTVTELKLYFFRNIKLISGIFNSLNLVGIYVLLGF
jgi:hypothetical protein